MFDNVSFMALFKNGTRDNFIEMARENNIIVLCYTENPKLIKKMQDHLPLEYKGAIVIGAMMCVEKAIYHC